MRGLFHRAGIRQPSDLACHQRLGGMAAKRKRAAGSYLVLS